MLLGVLGPKGDTQTVRSAELHGLCQKLKYTSGLFKVCTDSWYVYSTFLKVRQPAHAYPSNSEQWVKLWRHVECRGGSVELSWCPSHTKAADIDDGHIESWQFYGNYFADKLAGYAAQACQLEWQHIKNVMDVDSQSITIRRRLMAVHQLIAEAADRGSEIAQGAEARPKKAQRGQDHREDPKFTSKHQQSRRCTAAAPDFVHGSHQYAFSHPFHYCLRCGAHSNCMDGRTRKLKAECRPGTSGSQWLSRQGRKVWFRTMLENISR